MIRQDKIIEITKLRQEQVKIVKRMASISNRPKAKIQSTIINRALDLMALSFAYKSAEMQIHIIVSQPYPKFDKGCATVGEVGSECIILRSGKNGQR